MCPRLTESYFSHKEELTALEAVARQLTGVTFISGPETARTYVITAMGNDAEGIRACGLDIHKPQTFVPIPGVLYLERSYSPIEVRSTVSGVWPSFVKSQATLVVLNGCWKAVPELHSEILKLARRKHVIVADEFGPNGPELRRTISGKVTQIHVETDKSQARKLLVRVRSLGIPKQPQ